MSRKVGTEYTPNPHKETLMAMLSDKKREYDEALKSGDSEQAAKIEEKFREMLTEMRMISPDMDMSDLEQTLHFEAGFLNELENNPKLKYQDGKTGEILH